MKTKIALAATSAPATSDTISKLMQSLFGKPDERGQKDGGEIELGWMKSSIQCYLYPNGTVGIYVNVQETPTLEFDKVAPTVARKRIFAWAKIYAKNLTKQNAEIIKRHNKLVKGLTAFANSPAELPKML